MFHPFGYVVYALIPKDKHSGKFDSKARKAIMIGYTPHKKAYRLMDLGTRAMRCHKLNGCQHRHCLRRRARRYGAMLLSE